MSKLRCLALLSTLVKVAHGVHSGEDICATAVEGAAALRNPRFRRGLRLKDCSCKTGFSLVGDAAACGDGAQKHFNSKAVEGKGCKCMKNKACPRVETVPDFNISEYISAPWYTQQQVENRYLPKEEFFCVTARYEIKDQPSKPWRYTITVRNSARRGSVNGEVSNAELCAHRPRGDLARLGVAPCFLPKGLSGPYWVVAYNETAGFALISVGQPDIPTPSGCRTGGKLGDPGLWIFTRAAVPEPGLVETVRDMAASMGYDVSVLHNVTQEGCSGPGSDDVSTPKPASLLQVGKASKDSCAAAVDDAIALSTPQIRRQFGLADCTCSSGSSLLGDDGACGDGTQRKFKSKDLTGKSCKCMKNKACPKVETAPGFNLTEYISARWYAQQQMAVEYLPKENNYCVTARYEIKDKPSRPWQYTITVQNSARVGSVGGEKQIGDLCAYRPAAVEPAKLAVAPCFLPKILSGPYWVLAYNEVEGYALISGGQPSIATPLGCRTGSGVNNAGLWIFTREAFPEPGLVQTVRDIAASKGFDLGVLNDVVHEGCSGPGYDDAEN